MHTLEIDGVQLEFGNRRILSDVYVRCDTGNITALLGRNGCGKSCFMQIAFGTMKAYSVSVRCDGKYVGKAHTQKGLLHYLPQFHFIPGSMKVATALKHYQVNVQDFTTDFPEYEKDTGKQINELSGGQRRMIEVYIILKAPGKFVILDEPFSHIMPLHVDKIKVLLQSLKKDKGIIITDHLYKQVLDIADRIYLLNNGKTHHIADIEQLITYGYTNSL
ncbi:MAG: ATP-binding cassette domain-containing protein [Bacteroidetes bacterium]|nr:ATP-binding cassette domain-containing protein [Bacteroidota bacterium]